MSIQLILVGMTVPLLVLEVATLAELGLLGKISTGKCLSLSLLSFLHSYWKKSLHPLVNKCYVWPVLCRFSPFVKTGTESFVLGAAAVKSGIPDQLKVTIIVSPEGTCTYVYNLDVHIHLSCTNSFMLCGSTCLLLTLCCHVHWYGMVAVKINKLFICCCTGTPMWEPNPEAHTVTVREPSKQKKFKGIKTFTAYQVVPSSTGRAVSRRYKHYDWLHSRLEEKFTLNSVPPLPDKQYYGTRQYYQCNTQ